MRARESYETLNFKGKGSQRATYKGFSNTFNLFYEKPFEYSYGLAFGTVLSSLSDDKSSFQDIGNKFQFYFLGIEAKYFVWGNAKQGLFVRPGIYNKTLATTGLVETINTQSAQLSLGYEFLITESLSLAPEIGHSRGTNPQIDWQGTTFSLGLHFYNFKSPKDLF